MKVIQLQMVVIAGKQLYSDASMSYSSTGNTEVDVAAYIFGEGDRKVMEALGKELFPVEVLWQREWIGIWWVSLGGGLVSC